MGMSTYHPALPTQIATPSNPSWSCGTDPARRQSLLRCSWSSHWSSWRTWETSMDPDAVWTWWISNRGQLGQFLLHNCMDVQKWTEKESWSGKANADNHTESYSAIGFIAVEYCCKQVTRDCNSVLQSASVGNHEVLGQTTRQTDAGIAGGTAMDCYGLLWTAMDC